MNARVTLAAGPALDDEGSGGCTVVNPPLWVVGFIALMRRRGRRRASAV